MIKNITNVKGFKCWGSHSGVKSMRRDLAMIFSEVPANAAAVFTQNKVVAEPIKISREHVKDGQLQAIVINAGNANACTGEQGRQGAQAMVDTASESLGIDPSMILIASTGIIGEPFPTQLVVDGIIDIVPKLSSDSRAGSFAANAILTTDTFAKEGFIEFDLDDSHIHMAGIAKGSGMIHPNMATMLAFIVTDAYIDSTLLQESVKKAADRSFNMITVDGDTSTNDMVAVLANGLAGNAFIDSEQHANYPVFYQKLEEMMIHLAKLIVADGEGASKFIEYKVTGTATEADARALVRQISGSSLVKTAMYGRDPNWGRIVCAAGNAGVPFEYEKADLYLGDSKQMIQVLEAGKPTEFDRVGMKRILRDSHLHVHLEVHQGDAQSIGWGSDLTTDYVMFNSVYTT
ncbi:MAG: bifunctional glutamate N-acetyltransferase/amino-acid acetyltransferase ArgJ [Cyclobacteriaceae bacterium]